MTAVERTTALRRRTVLAAVIAAVGLAGAAAGTAQASGDLVDLAVVDREAGRPLQVWRHGGRRFVAGQPGARYALRVTNRTDGRVLVVVSVDGVNIITGETAGYRQRGYVLGPYQSHDLTGWRKSETQIAAFTFASLSQSYAARTGRPDDVGVIGVAVFQERAAPPPIAQAPRIERRLEGPEPPHAQSAAPSDAGLDEVVVTAQKREQRLGTAHGAREWSEARVVTFERATPYPQFIRRIEYDSRANLAAAGVIPPYREPGRRPRPFPADAGYAPDPPGMP
jgi:hypothetical protein